VDDVRHQPHPAQRSGGLPGGSVCGPPFGAPPYGVPPSGATAAVGRSLSPYGPAPFLPPQRTAWSGSPYPRTAPYPVPYPAPADRPPGAPPPWGRDLPVAVIAGITALVLAGVVTLVVLISHAAPGTASRTPERTAGGRQAITTHVVDDRAYTFDTDTQAQGVTVFAAIRSRPGAQIAH
jgi:hypothetical protein